MKITAIVVLSLIVLLAGIIFLLPSKKTTSQQQQTSKTEIISNEVSSGKAKLYDVRTPAEFAGGHAKLAENFDSVLITAGTYPQVSKDTKIYLYCHSGNRAGKAKSVLEKNGFTNVENLGGLSNSVVVGLF